MRVICCLFFLFTSTLSISQTYYRIQNVGYNNYELLLLDKKLNSPDMSFHTGIKPYTNSGSISAIKDSAYKNLFSHILRHDSTPGDIGIDMLFNLQPGFQLNPNEVLYETWASPSLSCDYKNKLSIRASALWSTSNYISFIDTFIRTTRVVPGMGTAYVSNKKIISSENYFGHISYSPNKIFNLQAGKDKHFWGDGYRSLFISDFAPTFPFLKATATAWKLKYTIMYAAFKDATVADGVKDDYKNKYGTFHFLSWNITKRINVGFFESIIWQGADTNRSRGYDANYLNPVIFFRPVEYSIGSSDNAFLGFSFKIKAFKKQLIYGQLILDEFLLKEVKARSGWWANKQGVQLGFRSFDVFKIKNLQLRMEGNYVRPYTYSHGSVQQSYGHLNHPLAHPLGANFMEGAGIINYRHKRIGLELKMTHGIYGNDSAGYNMGKNIFESYVTRPRDHGNYITQGVKTNLTTIGANINYLLYITRPIYLESGVILRKENSVLRSDNIAYVYLSLKAPLWNEYRDF